MKKIYFSLLCLVFISLSVISQTPQAIKYQAIARDDLGNIIADQDVSLRISILAGSASGTPVYVETHIAHSNQFGLLNIEIGNGTSSMGNFSGIGWGNNSFFVKTEMDASGGTAYVFMGTTQLLSVPYSLFSENTSNVDDADADPTNELQTLTKIGTDVTLSHGGGTVSIADNDNDPTNELQTLSVLGNDLSISNGNTVTLTGTLPAGWNGTLLYHDGSNWSPAPNLLNISGNLGIGTTLPKRPLEVHGPWRTARISSPEQGSTLELVSAGNDWALATWLGNFYLLHSTDDFLTKTDEYIFSTSEFAPYQAGSKTLGSSARRWGKIYSVDGDFNGMVGIGTSSPSFRLHVVDLNYTPIYAYSESHSYYAVHGLSTKGVGVYGQHTDYLYTSPAIHAKNTGAGAGLLADASSTVGQAVYGRALATSGTNYAIRGETSSASGYAGYFAGGRNYFEGNVGLGTTSPSYPIHLVNNSNSSNAFFENLYDGSSTKYGLYTRVNADGTGTRYGLYTYVYGNPSISNSSYGGYFYLNSNNTSGHTYGIYAAVSSSGTGNRYAVYGSASGGWAGYFPSGNTYIGGDLRVGSTTGATGFKVSVTGKIMCEEVRVELAGNWPDYVFDKEYQLMPINDLEESIKKNKHLPGFPSANKIEKDGIMLGDMAKTLTQKVEELTLYIIELNKKIEKLETENQSNKNK